MTFTADEHKSDFFYIPVFHLQGGREMNCNIIIMQYVKYFVSFEKETTNERSRNLVMNICDLGLAL